MSIPEALKGAKVELSSIGSPVRRCIRAAQIAAILSKELFGTLCLAPYGYRAWSLYRSLPDPKAAASLKSQNRVMLMRDVRYGAKTRNVMDIYLPPTAGICHHADRETLTHPLHPVTLFCHGGVWSAGEKWHYSPMASRLAQAGVIVCVMHYTLYPEVLITEMVAEVSAALTWVMANINDMGGDKNEVSLVGHSAGAHLVALALLHRAATAYSIQQASQAAARPAAANQATSVAYQASSAAGRAAWAEPSSSPRVFYDAEDLDDSTLVTAATANSAANASAAQLQSLLSQSLLSQKKGGDTNKMGGDVSKGQIETSSSNVGDDSPLLSSRTWAIRAEPERELSSSSSTPVSADSSASSGVIASTTVLLETGKQPINTSSYSIGDKQMLKGKGKGLKVSVATDEAYRESEAGLKSEREGAATQASASGTAAPSTSNLSSPSSTVWPWSSTTSTASDTPQYETPTGPLSTEATDASRSSSNTSTTSGPVISTNTVVNTREEDVGYAVNDSNIMRERASNTINGAVGNGSGMLNGNSGGTSSPDRSNGTNTGTPGGSNSGIAAPSAESRPVKLPVSHVMPKQAVLVCGVYDISKHYEYEKGRGVHEISTMKRVMGGKAGFAAGSPSVILEQTYLRSRQAEQPASPAPAASARQDVGAAQSGCQLAGEAIADRIGLTRDATSPPGYNTPAQRPPAHVMDLPLAATASLPPVILMSSCTDITVPWYESAEMYWRLRDVGIPAAHLLYNNVGHGDFVVDWPNRDFDSQAEAPHLPSSFQSTISDLPPHAQDLAKIVSGRAKIKFAKGRKE